MPIIFFYFLKIIFNISTLKQFKKYKPLLILKKIKFRVTIAQWSKVFYALLLYQPFDMDRLTCCGSITKMNSQKVPFVSLIKYCDERKYLDCSLEDVDYILVVVVFKIFFI